MTVSNIRVSSQNLVDAAIGGQQQNFIKKGEKEDVKDFNKVSDIMLYNIIISFYDKELM